MNPETQLFQVGAQFEICASPFEVASVGKDGLRINPIQGGTMRNLSFNTAKTMIDQGDLEITYAPPHGTCNSRAGLTDKQITSLNRRLQYVQGITHGTDKWGSKKRISPLIRDIAEKIGDPTPPSASMAAAWIKQWREGGFNESALLPKAKPSRRVESNPILQRIIMESLKRVYLHDQSNSITAVLADVRVAVTEHNLANTENKITPPSYEKVRRYAKRIDQYQKDVARYGKWVANREHRAAGIGFWATEPLELTMADGQLMDIIVTEDTSEAIRRDIGRPYLTAIIDVYSRCIIGTIISIGPFCGATLLKALQNAIISKDGQPRGVPYKIIVDNGSDYGSCGFLKSCDRLGITVEYSPPHMPNRKAHIERFFRTLNEQLIHKLPGTTFSNPKQRGDYDSQSKARLTLTELREHVETWLRDHYHVTEHTALVRTPLAVWDEAVNNSPIRTISEAEADILVRHSSVRSVSGGCVQAYDLSWRSDALRSWELKERSERRKPEVEVRIDQLDLSHVYVVTREINPKMFKAYSRHQRYTQNLSLYEHQLLKQKLKTVAAYERMVRMQDSELYRLRTEYFAALGHADDKVAAHRRDKLRDLHRQRESLALEEQIVNDVPDAEVPARNSGTDFASTAEAIFPDSEPRINENQHNTNNELDNNLLEQSPDSRVGKKIPETDRPKAKRKPHFPYSNIMRNPR